MMLEECGLPYRLQMVDIFKGEQFEEDFLKISPNNKIPALLDNSPDPGNEPIAVFESGAILLYLAEKTGKFLPAEAQQKKSVLEWLFWQVSALGPMMGQYGHFKLYAPQPIEYAINRYRREVLRLFDILDKRLHGAEYVAGNLYSIADIAIFPWVQTYKAQGIELVEFESLKGWYDQLKKRPALRRGMAVGRDLIVRKPQQDPDANKFLFGN
ncbi:MAG: glutathione S-transferase N-terminal domain-containing protein [Cellvibrionaceae bacterium]|nr:glutathione S-transferase N-terminal domain-containing protein [Cellvibrionaceae bacterium]